MKYIKRTLAMASSALLGLLFSASGAHAATSLCDATAGNLVLNCGFESSDFSNWTLSGNDVPLALGNLYGVEAGTDPDGNDPNSGGFQAYFADLVANSTTLDQTLTTTAGDAYSISFYLAQDGGLPDGGYTGAQLELSFGGVLVASLSNLPVQGYTAYTFTAVATSSSSPLSLTLGNDSGTFLLDDVSVVDQGVALPVPEPGSMMLMAGGLLALSIEKARRRTKR